LESLGFAGAPYLAPGEYTGDGHVGAHQDRTADAVGGSADHKGRTELPAGDAPGFWSVGGPLSQPSDVRNLSVASSVS